MKMTPVVSFRFAALALLLVMSPSIAVSAEIRGMNGNDWVQWPELNKVSFIAGAYHGMQTVALFVQDYMTQMDDLVKSIDQEGGKGRQDMFMLEFAKTAAGKSAMYNTTVHSIYQGVDIFYKDFRNRAIPIADAMFYVYEQTKGTPEEDLGRIALYLRQGKTSKAYENLLVRDKSGKVVRTINFPLAFP